MKTKAKSIRMDYDTLMLTAVHKVIGLTTLPRHPYIPGKDYCWMDDGHGTIYLQPVTVTDEDDSE